MSKNLQEQYAQTPLFGGNAGAVEALYQQYITDPASVAPAWRDYFDALDDANTELAHAEIRHRLRQAARNGGRSAAVSIVTGSPVADGEKQAAVSRLIQVYSLRGHQIADIDPLGLMQRPVPGVLKRDYLGLADADLDTEFYTGGLAGTGNRRMRLRNIIDLLQKIYCGKIGAEFAHVSRARERLWLRKRFEQGMAGDNLVDKDRRTILEQLTGAEGIERYLHTRYVGQKRFSLEGGESLIPMIDDVIQCGGATGIREIVIGMAHRGRINMLVNILGKSPEELFEEFEGNYDMKELKGSGDVKYHKGFSADMKTEGGNVHIALAFNPSHLEIVNPVVEGSVRARQQRRGDIERSEVLPLLVHGDAAFSGQGVVTETFQMSQTNGFRTGGTLHIVINNQIGFTTSRPSDARSTEYCSDVAKMIEAPIFHVNGDDSEAAIFVTRLALEYRQKFKKDVVIDLVCYRRHGHNEADEPSATQPIMYSAIKKHRTTREIYAEKLIARHLVSTADVSQMQDHYRDRLDRGEPVPKSALGMIGDEYTVDWSRYMKARWDQDIDTAVSPKTAAELARFISTIPAELEAARTRAAHHRGTRAHGERRDRHGLGFRRDHGLCVADQGGPRLPPGRAGHGPRDLLPPACRLA